MQHYKITVGKESCDIRGFTNVHVQCAVDHAAMMGGGVVELSEGVFHMADSLHLRTAVTVRGQGAATILRKNAMRQASVNCFLGYGHYDISIDQPDALRLGDGVWITDDNACGFYTTVGTLVRREGDLWYTTRPHSHDYHSHTHGKVYTLYPVISAYDVDDAAIEHVTVDGNQAENPVTITGCRGGGFFALRCQRLGIKGLVVRDCNSEGIGFQTCDVVEVADCLVERCNGNGLHPGSGTTRFHVRDCVCRNNTQSGLFYCLRVKNSVLENCVFEGNGEHGVSTGARDTDNVNRNLTLRNNGGCGFFFRGEQLRANAAHNNTIEGCTIENNCQKGAEAEILVQGATDGTRLIGNTVRLGQAACAVMLRREVLGFEERGNTFETGGRKAVVDLRAAN